MIKRNDKSIITQRFRTALSDYGLDCYLNESQPFVFRGSTVRPVFLDDYKEQTVTVECEPILRRDDWRDFLHGAIERYYMEA